MNLAGQIPIFISKFAVAVMKRDNVFPNVRDEIFRELGYITCFPRKAMGQGGRIQDLRKAPESLVTRGGR